MLSDHPHVESYCCREDLPLASQGLKKSHGVVSLDLTFLSVGVKLNSLGLEKEGHTCTHLQHVRISPSVLMNSKPSAGQRNWRGGERR